MTYEQMMARATGPMLTAVPPTEEQVAAANALMATLPPAFPPPPAPPRRGRRLDILASVLVIVIALLLGQKLTNKAFVAYERQREAYATLAAQTAKAAPAAPPADGDGMLPWAISLAAQTGDHQTVLDWVTKENVNLEDRDGATLSYYAHLRLTSGEDVNNALAYRLTRLGGVKLARTLPVWLADGLADQGEFRLRSKHQSISEWLEAGGDVNAKLEGRTYERQLEAYATLVAQTGAKVGEDGRMGDTLLHIAARTNSAELVHYLVGQGARTNALNSAGFTPLVVAAAGGQLKTMRALLVAARPVVANANGASFANVHPDFDAALSAADGRQQIRAISFLMEWWHRHHATQEHWFVKSLREKTAADGPAAMEHLENVIAGWKQGGAGDRLGGSD